MKQVKITAAGSILRDYRQRLPELAQVALDKYSNNRFKELKLVTKAFKYSFPFYSAGYAKTAFAKLFSVIGKSLLKTIPYLNNTEVVFMEVPSTSRDSIILRLNPLHENELLVMDRYLRYISHLARKAGLPLLITPRHTSYIRPRIIDGRENYFYAAAEEHIANTFDVYEIKIMLNVYEANNGYLLLYYADKIIKVLETLHRKARYATGAA